MRIREIDAQSEAEISLVAARMRQTLVEVLGEEKGTALYSMEWWLLERVRWHLDSERRIAKIYLAEDDGGAIIAHAIARVENDEAANAYGYFSTVFVEPRSRNLGVAKSLVLHVEQWFQNLNMPKAVYNTAANHAKLIRLFDREGYRITHREAEMVQLTKLLS